MGGRDKCASSGSRSLAAPRRKSKSTEFSEVKNVVTFVKIRLRALDMDSFVFIGDIAFDNFSSSEALASARMTSAAPTAAEPTRETNIRCDTPCSRAADVSAPSSDSKVWAKMHHSPLR